MRSPYILYKRSAGKKRPTYYVGFWSAAHGAYRDRTSVQTLMESLGERAVGLTATSRASADRVVQLWLEAGSPSKRGDTWWGYLESFWGRDGEYASRKRNSGRKMSNAYADGALSTLRRFVKSYLERVGRLTMTISQVDADFVETMLLWLQSDKEVSPRQLNEIRQYCSVAMGEAKRLGKIARNPVRDVIKFVEPKRRRIIFTPTEFDAFFSALYHPTNYIASEFPAPVALPTLPDEYTADPRVVVCNLLGATTGLRLGECLGLKIDRLHSETVNSVRYDWVELDNEASNWTEADGHHGAKSDSAGDVPVPQPVADAIRLLYDSNPYQNGWVFWSTRRNRPMLGRYVASAYNEACRSIGIDDQERKRRQLGFHAWRHFYASMMKKTGTALVQGALRHTNPETTEIYTHLTVEERRALSQHASSLVPKAKG